MSKKYDELADQIIDSVGGKQNIGRCFHCMTRLRFNLKDSGLADVENIKKLGVIGAQFSGEQLQIIIGNEVKEVYEAVCKKTGLNTEKAIDEDLDSGKKEKLTVKGVLNKVADGVVGCVAPLLTILIGSGLLKAVVMVAQNFGVAADAPTLTALSFIADSAFYFMPAFLGGFAAKKFGANIALGMMLGASLIHPTFIENVASGNPGSIYGLPIYVASYSSTVVPAILSVWVMSIVEKFISDHTPKSIRIVAEPFLTPLIMAPLTFCVLAPLGAMFSDVFAAVIPFVVMLGIHIGTVPISLASIEAIGMDPIVLPCFFIANFGQGAACLAVAIKSKEEKLRSLAYSCAFSDLIPGISEPGMYGITLKYKTPMWGAMIGSAAGGAWFGITKTGIYSFLIPNIFQFAGYIDQGNNPLNAVIGVVITLVVSFVATMILYKPQQTAE